MRKASLSICILLFLCGCFTLRSQDTEDLVSIQIIDRNGFSETISGPDRLQMISKKNFLSPQPYQKVVRIYGKSSKGDTLSKINLYHCNGQPWQYLEIENGRAHGKFYEWYPNGQLKIDASIIEGTPDLNEAAQLTWLFDGLNLVYNEQGKKIVEIPYEKGVLEGSSLYFHPNGTLEKQIPYHQDMIQGIFKRFDLDGNCIEQIPYSLGVKDGQATAFWNISQLKYQELYKEGALIEAQYYDKTGKLISIITQGEGNQIIFDEHKTIFIEYRDGNPEGKIQHFNLQNQLVNTFHMKHGKKNGEEWEYYPSSVLSPKLYIQWHEDMIDGIVKTWYVQGSLESHREMSHNKKQGLFCAWFLQGDLMFMEEYENDLLVKGNYFRPGEKSPISKIENGKGVAILFDKEGKYSKKIFYENGLPQNER